MKELYLQEVSIVKYISLHSIIYKTCRGLRTDLTTKRFVWRHQAIPENILNFTHSIKICDGIVLYNDQPTKTFLVILISMENE